MRARQCWFPVLAVALLSIAVAPAAALTQGELRAMRESARKLHRIQNGQAHVEQHVRTGHAHASLPPAPSSNLGGYVSKTRAGIKEWHDGTAQRTHPARTRKARMGVWVSPDAPTAEDRAEERAESRAIERETIARHTKKAAWVSHDPDSPDAEERAKWGMASAHADTASATVSSVLNKLTKELSKTARVGGYDAPNAPGHADIEHLRDGTTRVKPQMHHDVLGDYEQRTWAANRDSIVEKAEEEFVKHESPKAVHDCGLDGDECNYRGTGVEGTSYSRDRGSYMKAPTQELAQLPVLHPHFRPAQPAAAGAAPAAVTHYAASAAAEGARGRGARQQALWNAAVDGGRSHVVPNLYRQEPPTGVPLKGAYRGYNPDTQRSFLPADYHATGAYADAARTEQLIDAPLALPAAALADCASVNCAAEIDLTHSRVRAAKALAYAQHTSADAPSRASHPKRLARRAHTRASRNSRGAKGATEVQHRPLPLKIQVDNVEKVELTGKDIGMLAKELFKEARMGASKSPRDRKAADAAATSRQTQIRDSVAAAVRTAPETANVAKTAIRARAQHATHRRMLLPQGWPVAGYDPKSDPKDPMHTDGAPVLNPFSSKSAESSREADEGEGGAAAQQAGGAEAPAAADVEGESPAAEAGGGGEQRVDGGVNGGESEPVETSEMGGGVEGGAAGALGELEAPADVDVESPAAEAGGDVGAEPGVESPAAEAGGEEGAEAGVSEHLEPAPMTYLAGACCDSEGQNCKACPGPDEEYNMWDNLFIHPGDETGAGRHFIHALLAVLFIMLVVLVCTFVLEKRRGDTGEHPLDGMYQNTMEFGHTVGNSISDMSTKVNPFGKKEESVSGTHVAV